MIQFGPFNKGKSKIIRENTLISLLKNGKIKQVGGVPLSKVINRSILKK